MTAPDPEQERRRRQAALVVFSLIQAAAAPFFLSDALNDLTGTAIDAHTIIESLFSVGLVLGAVFGLREIIRMERQMLGKERALSVASGALGKVIEDRFAEWRLTASEAEVALLALKGLDTAEIANSRSAAAGTVRAQLSSIYAKAGVSGRAQFAALFVEELLTGGVPQG